MIMTKRQHKEAKKQGFKWIFVNHADQVMACNEKPSIVTEETCFGPVISWKPSGHEIGWYQGDLCDSWWTSTLELVV